MVAGKETEKQGIASAYGLSSPCFSDKSINTNLPRAALNLPDNLLRILGFYIPNPPVVRDKR
jgi:hypothetical protein